MKKCILMFCLAVFGAGCVIHQQDLLTEEQRILAKECKIGEDMLDAFRRNDFEKYIKYIPAGGRQIYNKEKFNEEQQNVASKLGKIVSYRFLTKLEMEPAHQLVWAVRFENHTLKGEPIYREALFVIVVGEVDESKKVFLFGFK